MQEKSGEEGSLHALGLLYRNQGLFEVGVVKGNGKEDFQVAEEQYDSGQEFLSGFNWILMDEWRRA